MSRVGKLPIPIPKGVIIELSEGWVGVKGPKGTLERTIHPLIQVIKQDSVINVMPREETRLARSLWGLTRTLINNMVIGTTQGFTKALEIVGVGYRVEKKGQALVFNVGYSHPIEYQLPNGVDASVEKQNRITLTSIDKELLGLTAAKIRAFRKPEPYKGKGIRYANEEVRRKVGKAGSK
jgi:large subunit ribosomal protein L6